MSEICFEAASKFDVGWLEEPEVNKPDLTPKRGRWIWLQAHCSSV
jgi:hypothetical protein